MLWMRRTNLIVRIAYELPGDVVPSRTSICALFWRTLAMIGVAILFCLCGGAMFVLMGIAAYGFGAWQAVAFWISVPMVAFLIRAAYRRRAVVLDAELPALEAFVKGAVAVKDRICPIVEIRP